MCVIYDMTIENTRRHLAIPSKLVLAWFLMKGLLLQEIALTSVLFQESIFYFLFLFKNQFVISLLAPFILSKQGMTKWMLPWVHTMEFTLWDRHGICHQELVRLGRKGVNVVVGRPSFKTRDYWELPGYIWDFENSDSALSTLTAVRSGNQKSEIQECGRDGRYGEETRYRRGEQEVRQKWLHALCLPKLAEQFGLC